MAKGALVDEEWKEILTAIQGIDIATLPEKLQELIQQLIELADSIISPSSAIFTGKTELAVKLQKVQYAMIRTAKISKTLVDLFSDFSAIRERIPGIKQSITSEQRICELIAFMEDVNDILSPALQKCRKIQDECKLKEDISLELARLASLKANEADSTRIKTQVGGGIGSGVALAGSAGSLVTAVGVVGSVVAGFFTLGIGTVVGLAATAGTAATVLGTAGGVGAALTASSANALYKDSEALQKLRKDSQAMSKSATSFGSEVIELQANIKRAVTVLERLKKRGTQPDMKEGMITVTCRTLDQFDRSAKRLQESVKKCEEIFVGLEEQLKKIDIEI